MKTFISLVLTGIFFCSLSPARSMIVREKFVMASKPPVPGQPVKSCQKITTLEMNYIDGLATLQDFVRNCRMKVPLNSRTFKFASTATPDGCGSYTWFTIRTTDAGPARLQVTDNRRRTCENVLTSLLVAKEFSPAGDETVLYLEQQVP